MQDGHEAIEGTEEQPENLTCASCRFFKEVEEIAEGFCLVHPPHFACGSGGERLVDGVPVDANRSACGSHPDARSNSVSDQFLKLLQMYTVMGAAEMQESNRMRQFFMGEDK